MDVSGIFGGDDVATTLAAMVKVGLVVGSLETAGGPVAWALEP